jgi:hypothetical protein
MHSINSLHLNAHQRMCAVTVKSLLILLLSGFFVCASAQNTTEPANQRLSAEARRVLDYLKSIQGNKMLAGHHVMYGRLKDRDLGYIVETTGKHTALIEFEAGIFARKYHEDHARLLETPLQSRSGHNAG